MQRGEEREGDECRASKTPDHMQIRGTDATRNVRARIIPDRFFCRTRDPNAGLTPVRRTFETEKNGAVSWIPPFNKGDAVTDRRH